MSQEKIGTDERLKEAKVRLEDFLREKKPRSIKATLAHYFLEVRKAADAGMTREDIFGLFQAIGLSPNLQFKSFNGYYGSAEVLYDGQKWYGAKLAEEACREAEREHRRQNWKGPMKALLSVRRPETFRDAVWDCYGEIMRDIDAGVSRQEIYDVFNEYALLLPVKFKTFSGYISEVTAQIKYDEEDRQEQEREARREAADLKRKATRAAYKAKREAEAAR